ncbi:hypothetical protein R3P38DRAFT_2861460 [Favolaschia claudopus]|uniref:F-box domain-containing protein n=1 Tax=Favolaschia claudopus TaxID=2862362 RepID=A0AAW0DM38_9AGAR
MSSMSLGPIFPQELLDAIVGHMNLEEYLKTLKSCSLVASILRYSSQRILLSRLNLQRHDYSSVAEHFADSPHCAGYVTTLVIGKEELRCVDWGGAQADTLAEVLSQLHQVQKCQLGGGLMMEGPAIHPLFQDFLSRQPLRELDLRSVNIPASLLLSFMKSLPTISVDRASVADDDATAASPVVGVPTTALTTLTVYSEQVGEFLLQPQSVPFLAKLQHLAIEPSGRRWPAALITAASSTLQHIEFMCQYLDSPLVQSEFPRLTALRVLEFFLSDLASVSRTSVTILGAIRTLAALVLPQMCPALEEVVIKRRFQSDWEGGDRPYVYLSTLLDAMLAAYPTPPRATWSLVMERGSPTVFDAFANAVRAGMPKAKESGRLSLRGQVSSGPQATKRPFPL